jgi:hypothetical protein
MVGDGGVLSTGRITGLVSLEILPPSENAPVEEVALALRIGVPFLDGTELPLPKERSRTPFTVPSINTSSSIPSLTIFSSGLGGGAGTNFPFISSSVLP